MSNVVIDILYLPPLTCFRFDKAFDNVVNADKEDSRLVTMLTTQTELAQHSYRRSYLQNSK